jgi:hypothetical protein
MENNEQKDQWFSEWEPTGATMEERIYVVG